MGQRRQLREGPAYPKASGEANRRPEPGRRTVWVLGAGCSRNYSKAAAVQRRYPGLAPPLQADFFSMAACVIAYTKKYLDEHPEKPLPALLYQLTQFYSPQASMSSDDFRTGQIERVLAKDAPNLEELFTLFDLFLEAGYTRLGTRPIAHASGSPATAFDYRAVSNLMLTEVDHDRFVSLLVATLTTSMSISCCSFHDSLARLIKPGDVVVTYNYDTLIDDALSRAGKLTLGSYQLSFFGQVHYRPVVEPPILRPRWTTIALDSPPVELLKLHGSINWILCSGCHALFHDAGTSRESIMSRVSSFREARLKEQADNPSSNLDDWILTTEPCWWLQCPRCISTLRRVIIPPILNKRFERDQFLVPWYRAAAALTGDFDLVVVGYSFPSTDFHSRLLFSIAHQPRAVTVVNPDTTVATRLAETLRLREMPTTVTPTQLVEQRRHSGTGQAN